ncbi:major facilitator superfamily domain-containing protein [Mrakia frigida]|uniref:major facilitator superfamily domain-containing protein n=1 Tax=Mrakia frigida TaxID=29902 RepID=UPI003FCBEF4C
MGPRRSKGLQPELRLFGRKELWADELDLSLSFFSHRLSVWGTNLTFALSSTAIATLSPQIASHFEHVELSSYIGSCFLLASTVFTPLFGGVLDHLSRPVAMVLAGSLFGVGTLGCAMSNSFWTLLAARGVTGAGGAGILTLSSIITTDLISLRERGYYQGLMMVVFGCGAAVGGPIAGVLSDTYGWETAFYAQLPLLVISLICLFILLPRPAHLSHHHHKRTSLLSSLDLPGTTLLLLSVGSLLLALSIHTSGFAWGDIRVAGLLVTAVLATVLFVVVERGREIAGVRVLVAWEVFGQKNMFWTCVSAFLMSLANGSISFMIPLWFVIVRSSTSATAGLHLLPNSLGLSFGSLLSGQIIKVTGRYRVLGLLSLVFPVLSAFALSRWGENTSSAEEWLAILPAGIGYSSYLVTSLIAIIASVPQAQIAKATAISYFFRTLGGTLGVAICASLQQAILGKELRTRFDDPSVIASITHSKAYLSTLPPFEKELALQAYELSLRATFLFTAIVGVAAIAAAYPVEEHHLGETGDKAGGGKKETVEEARTEGENEGGSGSRV